MGYKRYDYSLDMWSVGCMFASMVSSVLFLCENADDRVPFAQNFRREHFFRGCDNDDQLLKIMRVLGTDHFDLYLKKYNIHFETDIENLLRK